MKLSKPVILSITLAIFFIATNSRVISFISPSTPFIFNLKSKPIQTVEYLGETPSSRLANSKTTIGVYSTKKDNSQLKEIFQIAGVPYLISNEIYNLKKSQIIFLDLDSNNPNALTRREVLFLSEFVKKGGTLVATGKLNHRFGEIKELFGFYRYKESNLHNKLLLLDSNFFKYLDTKEEKEYQLSTINISPKVDSIILNLAKPIATYEDGSTAISINHYGKGKAINIALSLDTLRYKNLLDRDFNANSDFINGFEPLSDFIILFIKGVYDKTLDKSITLHTSAYSTQSAIIMTHNIKREENLKSVDRFIDIERDLNISSSCFLNVKYLSDSSVNAFFKPENFSHIQELFNSGVEIGLLSQPIHKNLFILPYGSCREKYPLYQQFGISDINNAKTTLCGELKVPKELLYGIGVDRVVSFRSDEFIYNHNLPLVLEELGYRYSSLFSAEDVLSYYPYRYPNGYNKFEKIGKIWEIPITLDNHSLIPIYLKYFHYKSLFKKIYDNGAIFNMELTPKKYIFDEYFIKLFYNSLPKDIWKCNISEFGSFWDKRDRVIFRYKIEKSRHQMENSNLVLEIYSPTEIDGLTFKMNNLHIKEEYGINIDGDKFSLNIKKGINRWVLELED
jgi:hypothetical protein